MWYFKNKISFFFNMAVGEGVAAKGQGPAGDVAVFAVLPFLHF